jgi:hypothetical protein
MKNLNIMFDDKAYAKLKTIKDQIGLTWEELTFDAIINYGQYRQ